MRCRQVKGVKLAGEVIALMRLVSLVLFQKSVNLHLKPSLVKHIISVIPYGFTSLALHLIYQTP